MCASLTAICAGVIMACTASQEPLSRCPETWGRITSLLKKSANPRNDELVNYLKSLTPEQMLAAARQGCQEGAGDSGLPSDKFRVKAAVSNALLCLEYSFDKRKPEELAPVLLERAADPREPAYLRLAIIGSTYGYSRHRFGQNLRAYTVTHWAEVHSVLRNMLKGRQEDAHLRAQTIESLAGVLRDQLWKACESDPNVRGALKDPETHGHEIVQITQLIESDGVELDPTTVEALKPVVSGIDESIILLGLIALDMENESQAVREQAKRTLKRYRNLRLLDLDEKIDQALQQHAGD